MYVRIAKVLALAGAATVSLSGCTPSKTLSTESALSFSSGIKEYDDAYKLALSEMAENTVEGRFIAGSGWARLWTRDTAYAVELAGGLVHPEASRVSLEACQESESFFSRDKVWLQDTCFHFGGWPALSDAIVGVQGAWSLYLASGDKDFLKVAYSLTKNTLRRAERDAYQEESGLFLGCSSFMESNSGYPAKYANKGWLVGRTKALSTNMLYYNGYKLGAMMGKELNAPEVETKEMEQKAAKLRNSIRERMWIKDKGHYTYVEDEDNMPMQTIEGLGTALVLLAPDFETDPERISSIFNTTYKSEYGTPCLWPKFSINEDCGDTSCYYHNGRLWPFVQSYFAIAAARHGRMEDFMEEFDGVVKLSQKGNTLAEFYELDGTHLDGRKRQLWSDAGFLGMVHQGLFGIKLEARGMHFAPVKPEQFGGTISLRNVSYRQALLHVSVQGTGAAVQSFKLDGVEQSEHFVPHDFEGEHEVEVVMAEKFFI